MSTRYLTEKVSAFLQSRAGNTVEQHRITVYLLHSVLVVTIILLQFMGLGGSHDRLPLSMSAIHLAVCLLSLSLYLTRRLTLSQAFSLTALVAQCAIAVRFFYFSSVRPDHFLQLILVNQIASLLAIFFLVMGFVRLTPLYRLHHQYDQLRLCGHLSSRAFALAAVQLLPLRAVFPLCAGRTVAAQRDERVERECQPAIRQDSTVEGREAQRAGDRGLSADEQPPQSVG